MALSNIFREPRREITETLVGLGVVVPLLTADYYASVWIGTKDLPWPFWMAIVPVAAAVAVGVLSGVARLIHNIGEAVCEVLDYKGIELRPKQRYR